MLTYENSIIVEPFCIVFNNLRYFQGSASTTFFLLADATYKHVYYIFYFLMSACVVRMSHKNL